MTRSLSVEGAGTDRLEVRPDTGTSAWISCAGRLPWGQPQDQRADDAWSVTYDWEVEEPLEVVGHPTVAVRLCSSAPVALLSAKLEDVFPDGTSALITRGLLNLSRRASLTEPEPVPVETPLDVDLELEAAAYEPLPIWRLEHDVLARTTTAVVDHGATYRGTHGVAVTDAYQGQVMVPLRDPGRASAQARCRFELAWPDVTCAVEADLHIDGHPDRFEVAIDLDATEDGAPFASRTWRETIPRDLL